MSFCWGGIKIPNFSKSFMKTIFRLNGFSTFVGLDASSIKFSHVNSSIRTSYIILEIVFFFISLHPVRFLFTSLHCYVCTVSQVTPISVRPCVIILSVEYSLKYRIELCFR